MNSGKCSVQSDTFIYSNEPSARTEVIHVRGEPFRLEILEWRRNVSGALVRLLYVHATITSKTKRFRQGMYASAVISKVEQEMNSKRKRSVMEWLMKEKTDNMIETARFLIENTYGKGKTFPNMRGRFTVLKIEDASQ